MLATLTDGAGGLSPRVRGNLNGVPTEMEGKGPIPACAGESAIRRAAGRRGRAYPRVCGGIEGNALDALAEAGLSPRVRGNRQYARPGLRWTGPIPACAGESLSTLPGVASAGAYPRVCGGIVTRARRASVTRGLSPRVRGNHGAGEWWGDVSGPIPACAGESKSGAMPWPAGGAYPRVCGGISTTAPDG